MKNDNINQGTTQGNMILGGILIALGIFFMLGQLFGIRLGHYVWPFYIIAPGLLLFIFALSTDSDSGEALASVGSVVTMTGLLLFYQNMADHFQSWAYGWALVAPTSIGLGQMVYGLLKEREQTVRNGKRLATIGVAIFLVGAIFFEFIIGISGFGIGRIGRFIWPLLLIALGIFVILRNQWPGSPANQSEPPPQQADPTQTLSQLKEMMDSDTLSEAEYEQKKAEILSSM